MQWSGRGGRKVTASGTWWTVDPGLEAPRTEGRCRPAELDRRKLRLPLQSDETRMNGAATSTRLACATVECVRPPSGGSGTSRGPGAALQKSAAKKCGVKCLNTFKVRTQDFTELPRKKNIYFRVVFIVCCYLRCFVCLTSFGKATPEYSDYSIIKHSCYMYTNVPIDVQQQIWDASLMDFTP